MEQIQLANGNIYDLVEGVFEPISGKLQITILANYNTLSEIESAFENEANTQKLKIIDNLSETISFKKNFTRLESITKQNDYIIGTEEYITDDGETANRNKYGTVYVIVLLKPDLYTMIKEIQETVDTLVLEGLEV